MNLVLEPLPESKKHQSSSSVESVLSLQNNDNESTANDTNSFGESFDALVEEAGAEARTKTPLYRIRWNPDPMAYVVFAVSLLVISIALAMFYIIHSRSIDQYAGELQAGIDQMDLLLASVSDPVVKATKSLSVASEDDLTVDLPVKMSSHNPLIV